MKNKYHYGCGYNVVKGWINIDNFSPSDFPPGAANAASLNEIYRMDITRPHTFPTGSGNAAYCEDVVEHLSQQDAFFFFTEVARVLETSVTCPNSETSVFRISCPGFEQHAKAWAQQRFDSTLRDVHADWAIFKYQTYERWGHVHLPTYDWLESALLAAGFTRCVKSSYRNHGASHRLSEMDTRAEQASMNHYINAYI